MAHRPCPHTFSCCAASCHDRFCLYWYDRELEVGIPTQEDRLDILSCHLAKLPHTLTDAAITRCAAVTHGYVAADLVSVCKEAAMAALRRRHGVDSIDAASLLAITEPDIAIALTRTSPSALREVAVDVPKVRVFKCYALFIMYVSENS